MTEHSILSASASKKWLNCPLSLSLEQNFEQEDSLYAKEGTLAHNLSEIKIKYLLGKMKRSEYLKQKNLIINELKDNQLEEMEKYTDSYVDYVIERYNKVLSVCNNAEILIEQKLDYSEYATGGFGTGDIVICDFENIEIIDLKYGKGIKVDAFENTQLMLYGLGALNIYDLICNIKSVTMTIFQPRIDNVSSYTMNTEDLIKFGKEIVKPKSELALNN